jgi:hypothetical protein
MGRLVKNRMWIGVVAGTVTTVLAGSPAWSQVAPAPQPESKPSEPAVRPAPTGQPSALPTPAKPRSQNPEEAKDDRVSTKLREGAISLPEDFNRELLVERDAQGRLVRFDRPLSFVAFERNPLIDAAAREKALPWLTRRQLNAEMAVVNNLDFVERIDAGEFERLDPKNRRALQWAERSTKLLRANGALSEWLSHQGVLTPEQAAGSQALGNSYAQARMREVREQAGEDRGAQSAAITRYMYQQYAEEAMWTYRNLLIRASGEWAETVSKVEMSEDLRSKLLADAPAMKSAATDEDRIRLVKESIAKAQDWVTRQEILDQVIASKFPDRSMEMPDSGGAKARPIMAYTVEKMRREKAAAAEKAKQAGQSGAEPAPAQELPAGEPSTEGQPQPEAPAPASPSDPK